MKFGELRTKFMGVDYLTIYVDGEVAYERKLVSDLSNALDNYYVSIITYDYEVWQLLVSLTSEEGK